MENKELCKITFAKLKEIPNPFTDYILAEATEANNAIDSFPIVLDPEEKKISKNAKKRIASALMAEYLLLKEDPCYYADPEYVKYLLPHFTIDERNAFLLGREKVRALAIPNAQITEN